MLRSASRQSAFIHQPKHWLNVSSRSLSTTNTTIPLVINGKDIETAGSHPVSKTKVSAQREIFLTAAHIIDKQRAELGNYIYYEINYQDFILDLTINRLKDTAGYISRAIQGIIPESNYNRIKAIIYKQLYRGIINIFYKAGLPDRALNLIFYSPRDIETTINTLILYPDIRKINFTRSTRVSSIISKTAGKYLKPVLIELSGKTTVKFRNILKKAIQDLFGSTNNTPIIITTESAQKNQVLISDTINKVILSNINKLIDLYSSELFRLSILLFTFKSLDNTITLANNTDYGLIVLIFIEDLRKVFRITNKLESGTIYINSITVYNEYPLPYSGVKKSRFGWFNSY
ncbi:unnamed protein product [Clonostachys rhizophaga]|uniref:Aldehyde dehydrogenase domain-containing protein n=1 Tax=Clonostachys rhizophaga TaxID=160324 RepID=A0A9N9VNT8_9HYPO|nr:unnamed protein product [Clonostachys rhizophaga]